MSNKTKKIFILSLLISVTVTCALSYFLYKIRSEGVRLQEQIEILTKNNEKESAYVKLKRLAQETEAERALLASSFFKAESDSINFLGEIETLASALGLSLRTEALDRIVDETSKKEYIKMTFAYEGQKDVVFNFSKLMEVTPYHSKVEAVSLRKVNGGNWEGQLTILITINSL